MTTWERRPVLRGWEQLPAQKLVPHLAPMVLSLTAWRRRRLVVLSSLDLAEYPDGNGKGEQWHISISRDGKRPTDGDVHVALKAFDLLTAEEDNHHPGNARHFWLPVDPAHRVDCQCKETEATIREPDGYQWTNPTAGFCRGCEWASISGKPCTVHGKAAHP